METYTFQLFDSRNTFRESKEQFSTWREAHDNAVDMCRYYHHVIVNNKVGFEEFEKGERVSWSYPNGCGQIKANS